MTTESSRQLADTWWESLFTGLAVTSLGILFTVLYVEIVLNRHEDLRWKPLRTVATQRINNFSTQTICVFQDTSLERQIRFDPPVERIRTDPLNYWAALHEDREWREYVRNTIIPDGRDVPRDTHPDESTKLRTQLAAQLSETTVLITCFRGILTPEQFSCLSDLQIWSRYTQIEPGEYF